MPCRTVQCCSEYGKIVDRKRTICILIPSFQIETWFAERSEQEAHLQKGMLESEKFYMQQTSTVKTVFMNALYNDDLSVDGKVNMILDKTGTENHFLVSVLESSKIYLKFLIT